MKTIAITIDGPTLARVDRLRRGKTGRAGSRSQIIRQAVQQYVDQIERRTMEDREDAILRRHRDKLARAARALVGAQAKP